MATTMPLPRKPFHPKSNYRPRHVASLSLHEILRRCSRERLIVHPLHWTGRHLDLLGCSFLSLAAAAAIPPGHTLASRCFMNTSEDASASMPPCKSTARSAPAYQGLSPPATPPPSTDDDTNHSIKSLPPDTSSATCRLAKSHLLASKEIGLFQLLRSSSLAAKRAGTRLRFRFQEFSCILPCQTFATSDGHDIAYLDASIIKSAREKSLLGLCKTRFSKPTWSLYNLRLVGITPSEPHRDPYIASLLIAMAQELQRVNRSSNGALPQHSQTHRVHVILSNIADKSSLHIFTADVSEDFLKKLQYTRTPPSGPVSLAIQVQSISYEPYGSFQERLVHTMFPRGQKRTRDVNENAGR